MSRLAEFDLNDTVTLRASFKVGTTLTDPTTVALSVTDPSGTVTPYSYPAAVTRDGLGAYSKALAASAAGEWIATWTGTGECAASSTSRFVVRRAGA